MIVIDASGAPLGRLASHTAKKLLSGEAVIIINAEKALISGGAKDIYAKYKRRLDLTNRANPRKALKFPRVPDRIVRRTVRGMLNHKTERGSRAYRRLKVLMGDPKGYAEKAERYAAGKVPRKSVSVLELSKMLGWKGGE